MVNASLETGADIEGSPGLHPRGIPLRSATSLFSANSLLIDLVLNVVAPLLHIGQERREHVTLDDVCPPLRGACCHGWRRCWEDWLRSPRSHRSARCGGPSARLLETGRSLVTPVVRQDL